MTKEQIEKYLVEKCGITKGNWTVKNCGTHWNNPSLTDYEIHWSEDGECICDTVYEKPDADLIASSFTMLRDWIMVANALSDITYEGFVFRKACENIKSALGKDWKTVKAEMEG